MFQTFIGITALAAVLSFVNSRFLKLPETIGVMILSILTSLFFGTFSLVDEEAFVNICQVIEEIDFRTILFDFLLGVLLFAGAIHVNLKMLLKERAPVITYATFGVVVSTLIIGTAFYFVAQVLGFQISFLFSLVFGALISPTDPVAVLALLKKAGAPKKMEIKIVGESLFNDGVGIVVFLSLLSLATMMNEFSLIHIGEEFALEAGGGLLMGLILGYVGKKCIKMIVKEPVIAVHISLAIVLGGYSLSEVFHISGAIAMVVAGLIIGHSLYDQNINQNLRNHMNIFWKVLDEIFNAVLFVLIGLEIIALNFELNNLLLGIIAIFIVLIARYITVFLSNILLRKDHKANAKERAILTWAGLRGGISIALALTLPESEVREVILFTTYVVVVFSILVQGLTIEKLVRKLLK